MLLILNCCSAGNAHFLDGGFVIFHVVSNTPIVRVSGNVNFGGSITVDTSLLPKGLSNITLMVFNSSTGRFSQLDNQFCSQQLDYLPHALVLDLDVHCLGNGDSNVPYLWILLIFVIVVVVAIIIGVIIHFIVKKKDLESRIDDRSAPYQSIHDE